MSTTPWKTTSPLPPLGVFGLIAQTFRLFFARFGTLFPLAFVPALALALIGWAITPVVLPENFDPTVDVFPAPTFGDLLLGVLSMVIGFFVIGFMCLAALDAVMGRSHTIGQYTRQTMRQLLPIGVLGIALTVMAAIGGMLLIVPGLYVLARFLPWVESVVFEDVGWSGLGRAQQLTEGYRWPLVGAVLLMGVIVVTIIVAVSPIMLAVSGGGLALATVLLEAVISGLYYALIAIFTALIYARLREIKEGMTIAQIAATIG
ncbi:hypothetical protein [Amaricoccus sp.]|mgnify:FL=1|uniref:hypothetical protein n=1 Tax=Amaricoccus sp. TaxID=1872485 RepID=UPI002602ED86|nr:hypothetical protein [uncultured Amaricoccus sp.]